MTAALVLIAAIVAELVAHHSQQEPRLGDAPDPAQTPAPPPAPGVTPAQKAPADGLPY